MSFWYSARIALWQAIAALGLREGGSVAVPAYCCGSELDPFVHAGLALRPYRLDDRLDPEAASFAQAAEGADAALATHYFGMPADLRAAQALCQQQGIPLIEDCAHALYATTPGAPVGMTGAAAVFSLWKSLAIPDGGALLLRADLARAAPTATAPPAAEVMRHTRRLVSHHLQSHPAPAVRGAVRMAQAAKGALRRRPAATAGHHPDDGYDIVRFRPELATTAMSPLAQRLFGVTDHAEVRRRRRARYEEIAGGMAGLPGLAPLFPQLRDGASPLFFPVVVEEIDSFRRTLAARGIGMKQLWTCFHPALPWDDFPREARLKRYTVGLPVHQSLTDQDVQRLIAALREWGHR